MMRVLKFRRSVAVARIWRTSGESANRDFISRLVGLTLFLMLLLYLLHCCATAFWIDSIVEICCFLSIGLWPKAVQFGTRETFKTRSIRLSGIRTVAFGWREFACYRSYILWPDCHKTRAGIYYGDKFGIRRIGYATLSVWLTVI